MPLMGKTKQDIVSEFRNAEILEAARTVFAEKGFNDASVQDIAQAAGVAKGTLYLYYRSKRAIYWAALKNGLVALCDELKDRMQAADTLEAKVRAFVVTKLTYFEEHRDFFRIYYSEFGNVVSHPAFVHKDFKDLYLEQLRVLRAALQDGVKRKAIRNIRADAAAFAIFDVTRGLITQRLLGWSKAKIEDDIAFVVDLIWKGLAGR